MNTTHLPDSINPFVTFSGLWPYRMILNTAIIPNHRGPPDNTTVLATRYGNRLGTNLSTEET
jgi:hypothetical protein